MDKVDLDLLVGIAQEVEGQDSIPWDRLAVGKEQAYKMVAASILEMFDKSEYHNQTHSRKHVTEHQSLDKRTERCLNTNTQIVINI